MKLETWTASEEKARWKIVRTDTYVDVCPPGEIISACEATGECSIQKDGETKALCFGSGGIRIVGRKR